MTITHAGSSNTRTHSIAVSASAMLLNDSSLPWSMRGVGDARARARRARGRTRPADADSRRSAGPGSSRTQRQRLREELRGLALTLRSRYCDTIVSYFAVCANAFAASRARVCDAGCAGVGVELAAAPARSRPDRRRPSPTRDSSPRRAPSPGRRCRCSRWRRRRCSRASRRSARTDRGSRPAGRSAAMPCFAMTASSMPRRPSRPPCIARMQRLHAPVHDLGEAGVAGDFGHRGCRRRPAGARCRRCDSSSTLRAARARARSTSPVLSETDRRARADRDEHLVSGASDGSGRKGRTGAASCAACRG